ncbi:ROK family protein, partial [Francisellaceae bacterium]|nr:ROK family protein [Francisellaceae bacterium]
MKYILSFDIGGTGVKYGVVTSEGELIYQHKFSTPKPSETQGKKLLDLMLSCADELTKKYEISAIGVSTHGVVDFNKGIVTLSSHHLPGLKNLPIKKTLKNRYGVLVTVDNDVNSAAIGELWQGSAKQYKNFIFIALGTSIGGAVIVNRHLVRGRNFCGGEIGYLITNEKDKKPKFMPGAWESYASASVLTKRYLKAKKNTKLSPDDFQIDLANGDAQTIELFERFVFSLTSGMISLAHTLDPDAFILGGAIVGMNQQLFDPVIKSYKSRSLSACADTPIMGAELGNTAGMIG